MRLLVLGVNGFIGNALTEHVLNENDWEIYGLDIRNDKLGDCLGHERFHYVEGDISINREWIEYHVKKCDVVMPLVAIATPMTYVREPLKVFELDAKESKNTGTYEGMINRFEAETKTAVEELYGYVNNL